jgi:hypothetical protein
MNNLEHRGKTSNLNEEDAPLPLSVTSALQKVAYGKSGPDSKE